MNQKAPDSDMVRVVSRIEEDTIERYSGRLRQFGDDPRALGWDTRKNQEIRFSAVTELVNLSGRDLVDIGCGFADLYGFLAQRGMRPSAYRGVDVNNDILEVARRCHPDLTYERRNLLLEPYPEPVADIGVMLGLLNFRLRDIENYHYAEKMIEAAFGAVRHGLVVDFLSLQRTPDYPEEANVFYYDPEKMLHYALTLTPDVVLKHDYPPIPQKEFMLFLRKK